MEYSLTNAPKPTSNPLLYAFIAPTHPKTVLRLSARTKWRKLGLRGARKGIAALLAWLLLMGLRLACSGFCWASGMPRGHPNMLGLIWRWFAL
jgi:hypothetical protein